MEEKDIIASNITYYRKKLGLSQLELAEKLQYSNKNISKWEKGETTPSVFTLKKLASIFGITLDELTIPPEEVGKEKTQQESVQSEPEELAPPKHGLTFTVKLLYLLMANAILLLCAYVAIFILGQLGVVSFNRWLILVYITPLSALSVFIFIACIKKRADVISISLFGWLIALSVYLSLINKPNMGFIFLIAFGFELILICVMFIINLNLINRLKFKLFKQKYKQVHGEDFLSEREKRKLEKKLKENALKPASDANSTPIDNNQNK